MSYTGPFPLGVPIGATGDIFLTNHGVLIGAGVSPITQLAAAASGTVMIGNGSSSDPSFSATPTVNQITIINAPVNGTDGVNKTYADSIASGFTFLSPVLVATTGSNLNATYNNGSSGVGATLTNAGTQLAFALDGVTTSDTDRVLIKDQTTTYENGVYSVTTEGDGTHNWVLTRTTDYDTTAQIVPGTLVPVTEGTDNTNTVWLQTQMVATIGTDPILFSAFSGAGISQVMTDSGTAIPTSGAIDISGGSNINTEGSGNTITVNLNNSPSVSGSFTAGTGLVATTGGLTVTAGGITSSGTTTLSSLTAGAVQTNGSGVVSSGTLGVPLGGTGAVSQTSHSIILGNGTSALSSLGAATNGQIPIGSTSNAPSLATITAGTGISVTNGSGTITIASASAVALSFTTDSGTATPASGTIDIAGGSNINTGGATDVVTINLNSSPSVSGSITAGTGFTATTGGLTVTAGGITSTGTTTLGSLGAGVVQTNSSGVISSSGGTDGQLLISSSIGAPSWANLTAGSNITITNGHNSIEISSSSSGATIYTTSVTLTSAQLKNLSGTPISIVAAQGANTVIMPFNCGVNFVYGGSNAFTNPSSSDLYLYYTSNANTLGYLYKVINYSNITATSSLFINPSSYGNGNGVYATGNTSSFTNAPLVVQIVSGASNLAGNAAGDNTLTIYLSYYVITI